MLVICQYSCNSEKVKVSCSKYKNGNFSYRFKSQQGPISVKIIRNDSLQTEITNNTTDTNILKVKWIDSCTYELKYLKVISKETDSLTSSIKKTIIIKTSIIEGTNDYYLFESSNNKTSSILKDTIWIDNQH